MGLGSGGLQEVVSGVRIWSCNLIKYRDLERLKLWNLDARHVIVILKTGRLEVAIVRYGCRVKQ